MYDPVGNIVRIADAALLTVFQGNQQVSPACSYTYDALYRLDHGIGQVLLRLKSIEK